MIEIFKEVLLNPWLWIISGLLAFLGGIGDAIQRHRVERWLNFEDEEDE